MRSGGRRSIGRPAIATAPSERSRPSDEAADQRRLAGAVRSDEADEFARRAVNATPSSTDRLPKCLQSPSDLDHDVVVRSAPWPTRPAWPRRDRLAARCARTPVSRRARSRLQTAEQTVREGTTMTAIERDADDQFPDDRGDCRRDRRWRPRCISAPTIAPIRVPRPPSATMMISWVPNMKLGILRRGDAAEGDIAEAGQRRDDGGERPARPMRIREVSMPR